MKARTGDTSFVDAVLHVYERWSTQAFVYFTTIVVATGMALVLDLRLHWPPERVLLYVLPLTALLLVVVPSLYVVLTGAERFKSESYVGSVVGESLDRLFPRMTWAYRSRETKRDVDQLAKLIAIINTEIDRIGEITGSQELASTSEVRQQLTEAKRNLTMIRFRQLDLRLKQSGISPLVRVVLGEILSGLRELAERDINASVPEELRAGFERGLDTASAAVFDRVAVVLAYEAFYSNRPNYPASNPEVTLNQLAEQERFWLFKHEHQP